MTSSEAIVIVKGTPISHQSKSNSKLIWKEKVAQESRTKIPHPLSNDDIKIRITVYYNGIPTFDIDNISKPICDALNGIAYEDDSQIQDRIARKRSLNSSYRIKGIKPELAVAMAEGDDFVSIEISIIGEEIEVLA